MEKEQEKKRPFQITEYYSPGLNSLKRIYTQHPKFNGNVRLIYELLFDHWNAEYGYAFPTIYELARESGLSTSSVKRFIDVLKELDLIEVKRSPIGKINNVYYIKQPVTSIEEFYNKFPDIEEKSKERIEKINAEEAASLSRLESTGGKGKKKGEIKGVAYPDKKEIKYSEESKLGEITKWL